MAMNDSVAWCVCQSVCHVPELCRTVQKRLNPSSSCSGWRLWARAKLQATLDGDTESTDHPHGEKKGSGSGAAIAKLLRPLVRLLLLCILSCNLQVAILDTNADRRWQHCAVDNNNVRLLATPLALTAYAYNIDRGRAQRESLSGGVDPGAASTSSSHVYTVDLTSHVV